MLPAGDLTALPRSLAAVPAGSHGDSPPVSGSARNRVEEAQLWPPGGPRTGVLRARHFEKVRVSQPAGRREFSQVGTSRSCRVQKCPAFEIVPLPRGAAVGNTGNWGLRTVQGRHCGSARDHKVRGRLAGKREGEKQVLGREGVMAGSECQRQVRVARESFGSCPLGCRTTAYSAG